jgi:tRNA A37 methylthiotransferase MiaB
MVAAPAPTVTATKKAYIIEQHVCYRRLLDASKLANYFRANDCEVTKNPDEADYLVLFTCAVTAKIEREAFLAMAKLSGHKGELIVMGCLPDIAPAKFNEVFQGRSLSTRDMDNVDTLFREHRVPYSAIPEPYDKLEDFPEQCVPSEAENAIDGRRSWLDRLRRISVSRRGLMRVARYLRDKTDAAIETARHVDRNTYHFRISRGCKGHCTYCGIKFAIGPLKSRPLEECLRDYQMLLEKGCRHFHILAEDVGAFGLDIGSSFGDLLERMSDLDRGYPVRWNITELNIVWAVKYRETLARMIGDGKLTTLQIAQESGSPRILRKIKKYSLTENIDAAIASFRKANPLLRLSGLFIVGFPSETEEDFQLTLDCIRRNYHDGVNLAPYSDREGTAASLFPEKIDGKVIRDRIERAMAFLDREKITWTVSS